MELLFDHTHGKQQDQDIVICRPMAVVDEDESTEALDTGWLALDHPWAISRKCGTRAGAHGSTCRSTDHATSGMSGQANRSG